MTGSEEQKMMEGISGIARGMSDLLALFSEISVQRAKTDEEIVNLLKLISRKH